MTDENLEIRSENILIVDDTPANLRLLSNLLMEEGYTVRPVLSGSQALSSIRAELPDLILLDIMMPERNGYEVCGDIKADKQARDIPVIFISALDEVFDKVRAFEVGGVDYLTKPFQSEEVLARVRTHLTLRRAQQELEKTNSELREALEKVKVLSGLLPICVNCKKIRDDAGYWHQIETYIRKHSSADFSHGLCPGCAKELYPEYYKGD